MRGSQARGASDGAAKLLDVKPYEVQRSIEHSMTQGAARVLDRSRVLDPDPKTHATMLTARAVAAQQGSEAAWEDVIDGMSRLVFRTAETYFWKWHSHLAAHASFDDVFMAGMEGLTIGVNKFDGAKGYMLSTYAVSWIRTKVQRACYAQCGSARIPEELLQAGVSPMDPLVASAARSLDWRADDEDATLGEQLASPHVIESDLHELEGLRRTLEILALVDEKLPAIAELLERGVADREIARQVGLTTKRVEQLRCEAAAALIEAGVVTP